MIFRMDVYKKIKLTLRSLDDETCLFGMSCLQILKD